MGDGSGTDERVLARYRGVGQFGRAYRRMYRGDGQAPESVARVLLEEMVQLCAETAPVLYGECTPTRVSYRAGARPAVERHAEKATRGATTGEERVAAIARFCAGLDRAPAARLEEMVWGGAEEEIVERGSCWCTD